MSLFEELKRRNVFRVGIAYVLLGWVVLQGADFALDLIDAPNWIIQALFIIGLVGLPFALFFAWAFELTPEGIKREEDVDRSQSVTPQTGRKLDRAIILFLILIIVGMGIERFYTGGQKGSEPFSGQNGTVPGTTASAEKGSDPLSAESSSGPPAKSVAVLPFADLSQGQDQGWFADGLAEEILNALARTPDLLVASRTSSFRYKDSDLDISSIASELGVAHVLEGSVRGSGNRLRVTAQLIRASDGFHVWSENYDRDAADMIAIQEDLARSIADVLETTMDPEALAQMSQVGTESVEAYRAYLQGLALTETRTGGDANENAEFLRAYELFERARSIDPGFARAHRMAANFWQTQLAPTRTDSGLTDFAPEEMLREFDERIDLAIANAPSDVDRLAFQGDKAQVGLRLREAIRLYKEYLEARPQDILTRSTLMYVAALAEDDATANEVLVWMKERGLTDPVAAQNYINEAYRHRREEEAAEFGLAVVDRWPTDTGLLYQAHRTLLWAGRREDAKRIAQRYLRAVPEGQIILEAREACADGDRDTVERMLAEVESRSQAPMRQTAGGWTDVSTRWHLLMLLNERGRADEVLRPLAETGIPYMLADFMIYHQFDPTPFPLLVRVMQREGIERPPAVDIPFACPPPEQPSIAVLPFRDMSPGQDQGYFGEGIAEELLNGLVKLDGIKVASRTSTFALADDGLAIPELAGRLGVANVLEGSVRTAGNQVRVTAQLIDVADDKHLWSETFDGTLDDIFKIQDEITGQILDQLEIQLAGDGPVRAAEALTEDPEAYRLYLQGRALWRQRTIAGLRQSIELFERAVALDPGFHAAWANMAAALLNVGNYDPEYGLERAEAAAEEAADRALAIDPQATEALSVKAELLAGRCEQVAAARLYEAAIEANPQQPTPRHWWSLRLATFGHLQAAREQIGTARALDPLISAVQAVFAMFSAVAGDYASAGAAVRNAAELGAPQGISSFAEIVELLEGSISELSATDSFLYDPLVPAFNDALADPSKLPALEQQALALEAPDAATTYTVLEMLALAGSEALPEFAERESCPQIPYFAWSERYRAQRGTPEFFRYMERAGVVDFWREYGWPDDCASLDQELADCAE